MIKTEKMKQNRTSCSLDIYDLVITMSSCNFQKIIPLLLNANFLSQFVTYQLTFSTLNRKFNF